MKHQWQLRRSLVAVPDGQQRWDRAYQSLLAWSQLSQRPKQPPEVQHVPEAQDVQVQEQEVAYARSGVCACLDAEPGTHADH